VLSKSTEAPLVEGRLFTARPCSSLLDDVREHRPEPAMVEKFFDYIEPTPRNTASATLGQARFLAEDDDLFEEIDEDDLDDDEEEDEDEDEESATKAWPTTRRMRESFHAAYDEMVYTDSTDDGVGKRNARSRRRRAGRLRPGGRPPSRSAIG